MMAKENYPQCPECRSGLVHDFSKGEYICQNCGYVVLDKVDYCGQEYHTTDLEVKSKNTRASGHTSFLLHNYGLRTEIGLEARDYSGRSIDFPVAEQMNNIRKWHLRLRTSSSKERRVSTVLSMIDEICSKMFLPKPLAETAAMLYRNYTNRYETKGMSVIGIAAAAIYLACKRCLVVRSLEEIVEAIEGCSDKRLTKSSPNKLKIAFRYYKTMAMEMSDLQKEQIVDVHSTSNLLYSTLKDQQPINLTLPIVRYISKLVNTARIDMRVERLAIDIARKTENNIFSTGKDPNGLAAAYIYLSSTLLGINLMQRDIATIAGVTEVTVRTRCREILTTFRIAIHVKEAQNHI